MQQNKKLSYMEKVTDETLDIWFPTMKDKNKIKKTKNLPLGKSIYETDDYDDLPSTKSTVKIKRELDELDDLKINKSSSDKDDKKTEYKSRKDRTSEEDEEILDLMYPSIRHLAKDKVNKTDDEKSEKDSKKGHFAGGASGMKQSSNNTMKVPDNTDKENSDIVNKKQDNKQNSTKPVKSEEERSRDALKVLGMDDNEYQIKGNTISRKEKPKDYEIINGIKYPKNTNNQNVQEMKNDAIKKLDENNKLEREKYLKSPKSLYKQFGVDHVDNPIVKSGERFYPGKEAAENLHMSKTDSYMDTKYAKEHKVLNNYKEAPKELHEYFEEKIHKQIGKDKLETTKGVYIEPNSKSSKKLAKDLMENEDFIKKLKDYEKPMNHNLSVDESISFKDTNWHNAIGNGDIRKMHINKNGDIELYVTDTYDFNKGERTGAPAVGRDRQEKGEIKPYFEIYHVIIPREKYDKIRSK